MPNLTENIEARVKLAIAVANYLQSAQRFAAASRDFNETCETLRSRLDRPCRFVTRVGYQHFLVTSDRDRNFEVELIEVL